MPGGHHLSRCDWQHNALTSRLMCTSRWLEIHTKPHLRHLLPRTLLETTPHHSLSATNHSHLAMHVFGALRTASAVKALDAMVHSAAEVFFSPSCGASVEKHFKNLRSWLQKTGTLLDDATESRADAEDLKVNVRSII
ncbi:hypothetical protein G5714_002633 [Onychostoma macrolepis]|uniref:Uncharacterized protein n=1 Tax=Onychostoma macrolepis TaxID=369639 RepID=A0A7J6D8B5_9TELE|nr:hypothetical protein G5714_002633 [Onychostoma macrolepis]